MQPGFYPDLPADQYHSSPGVSKSMLDRLARSPAHLKYGQAEPTPAQAFGTAVHCAILEPDAFEQRYYLGSEARRGSKEWQRLEEQAAGRLILKPAEWDQLQAMRDSVHAHPSARELLRQGQAEVSVFWQDEETTLLCRARPDYLRLDQDAIIDLKTSTNASVRAFARDGGQYRYFVQDAYYRDGVLKASGLTISTFCFLVVEKDPPYAVGLYELTANAVARGRAVYQQGLRQYAYCQQYDQWHGYSALIEEIDIPPYCYTD